MRFSFTGNVNLNGLDTPNPYHRTGKTSSNKDYESFNMSVVAQKNNRAYAEVFGMVQDNIKTKDTDGNDVEISWSDRNDSDVLKNIANYKKNVIKIGDDRKEFLSSYDFVKYLASIAEELKTKKVTVTGQTQTNIYQGKLTHRFTIQNIYEAAEDSKNQLKVSTEYFFNKNCFDTSDWASEHKLMINGYVSSYINKDTGNKYTLFPVVLDCSKIDWDNEKHVKLVQYKLKMLGCELVDGKIKCKLKNSNYYKMATVLSYQNGAEEVEFTEEMLTDTQKELLELGVKTLDDFRPAGSTFGARVTVYKIVDFDVRGDYEDGIVDTELSESEFDESVYTPAKEESVEDLEKKASTKVAENKATEEDDEDDSDLFG